MSVDSVIRCHPCLAEIREMYCQYIYYEQHCVLVKLAVAVSISVQ